LRSDLSLLLAYRFTLAGLAIRTPGMTKINRTTPLA